MADRLSIPEDIERRYGEPRSAFDRRARQEARERKLADAARAFAGIPNVHVSIRATLEALLEVVEDLVDKGS